MLEFQVQKRSEEENAVDKDTFMKQKTTLVDVTWTHEEMIALTEMFKSAVTEDLTRRELRKQSQTPMHALTPQDLSMGKTMQMNGFTEMAALQASNPTSELMLKS